MKSNSRVYAAIHLDAVEENFKQMKQNLKPGVKMIAVVKTDGYGHGAVPIASWQSHMNISGDLQLRRHRKHSHCVKRVSKSRF